MSERAKVDVKASECEDMSPLTVDEQPDTTVMERADTLQKWYTMWLWREIYASGHPISLKKAIYGAEGDSKRENKGIGSAITFRRYLNGKVWASNPAYRIYQDAGGERWVDRT